MPHFTRMGYGLQPGQDVADFLQHVAISCEQAHQWKGPGDYPGYQDADYLANAFWRSPVGIQLQVDVCPACMAEARLPQSNGG